MQRNLDKDDIRDASDLLTHIDGWEKTVLMMRRLSRLLIDGMRNESAYIAKQRLCIRKYTHLMRPM